MDKSWLKRLISACLLTGIMLTSVCGAAAAEDRLPAPGEILFYDDDIPEEAISETGDVLQAETKDYPNTWKNTGDQAKDIAAIAQTQLGYQEWGDNHTKYNIWFWGKDVSQPWCGSFISWCANQAGVSTNVIRKNALVNDLPSSMMSNSYGCPGLPFVGTEPKVGDILYLDTTGDGRSNHAGIVVRFDKEYVYTVEGNASNSVAERLYYRKTGVSPWSDKFRVVFIARPKYKVTSSVTTPKPTVTPTPTPEPSEEPVEEPTLGPMIPPDFENPFEDVAESDWFYEPVLWAVENGVTGGTSATTFSPKQPCTRGQVMTFLWAYRDRPEHAEENPFSDVLPRDYYYDSVLWAVEHSVTGGTSAVTFSPKATCTRAQVMTFLWAEAGRPEPTGEENPFSDVPSNAYYYDAVLWAVENGITSGMSANTFGSQMPCTRGQVMTFLYRAAQCE